MNSQTSVSLSKNKFKLLNTALGRLDIFLNSKSLSAWEIKIEIEKHHKTKQCQSCCMSSTCHTIGSSESTLSLDLATTAEMNIL